MADYDALTRTERARLEAFAARFADVDPADYALFAGGTPLAESVREARAAAEAAAGTGTRRRALGRAMQAFGEEARVALGRRFGIETIYLGRTSGLRSDEIERFFSGLERAVVAVVLWDDLSEDERQALAGAWIQQVEAAAATA